MAPESDQLALIDGGPRPVTPGAPLRVTPPSRRCAHSGRLEACDALLVALLRTCADRCDELRGVDGKEFHEAQALRLAGELEARLRSLGGPSTDAFDQLLAAATGPAPPGDPA